MTVAKTDSGVTIRAMTAADVAGITRCVCAAYLQYIERVGRQPSPMLQDYSNVIRTSQVHVAARDGRILAMSELMSNAEVSASISGFERYLDRGKINAVLRSK